MCPITHVSYVVLAGAVIASFIFGFLWYGPLFGKTWAGLMGFKIPVDSKDRQPPVSSLLITLLGVFFTTVVLGYLLHATKPCCNFGLAAMVWLGFYVPLQFGTVTWEQKPWKLFFLNTLYNFLNLQLIAAILTYWKI
jgi:hypothetical protein